MAIKRQFTVVVSGTMGEIAITQLNRHAHVIHIKDADRVRLLCELPRADALIFRTNTNVDSQLLRSGSKLRVVGRAGVGLDNVDLAAARREGIDVVYTPAASTTDVVELTLGLIIATARQIPKADREVRRGNHAARKQMVGEQLRGKTLGIIGAGRIGSAVGHAAHAALGMAVIFNDIRSIELAYPARAVEKEVLYRSADVITLHTPLTPLTYQLINTEQLKRCRRSAILINAARGSLVASYALADALQQGRLSAAALDVTDPEPLPTDHPLLGIETLILTPHIGARTTQGQAEMDAVVDDVLAVLNGKPPRYPAPTEK